MSSAPTQQQLTVFQSTLLSSSLLKFNSLISSLSSLPVYQLYDRNIRLCSQTLPKKQCEKKYGFYEVMEGPIKKYETCKEWVKPLEKESKQRIRECVQEFNRQMEKEIKVFEKHVERYVDMEG